MVATNEYKEFFRLAFLVITFHIRINLEKPFTLFCGTKDSANVLSIVVQFESGS
jgi:hypothetical protein